MGINYCDGEENVKYEVSGRIFGRIPEVLSKSVYE